MGLEGTESVRAGSKLGAGTAGFRSALRPCCGSWLRCGLEDLAVACLCGVASVVSVSARLKWGTRPGDHTRRDATQSRRADWTAGVRRPRGGLRSQTAVAAEEWYAVGVGLLLELDRTGRVGRFFINFFFATTSIGYSTHENGRGCCLLPCGKSFWDPVGESDDSLALSWGGRAGIAARVCGAVATKAPGSLAPRPRAHLFQILSCVQTHGHSASLPACSLDRRLAPPAPVGLHPARRSLCLRILVLASATSRSSSCSGTWVDGRRSTYVRACRVVERTERLNTRWTDMPARRAFTPQGKHGSAVGVIPGARQTWLGRCDQGDQRSAVSEASASLPETAVEGWGKAWPSASRP